MSRCLQLCEILEEEYEQIHGPLPETYQRPPLPGPEHETFQNAHAERLARSWDQIPTTAPGAGAGAARYVCPAAESGAPRSVSG
jgi:hypothetical protein